MDSVRYLAVYSDIYFVATCLNDRGCLRTRKQTNSRPEVSMGLTTRNADEAIQLGKIWRRKVYEILMPHYAGLELYYQIRITGSFAAGWLMSIYPMVSVKTRARIRRVLAEWRSTPQAKPSETGRHPDQRHNRYADCHPHRRLYANRMCRSCYTGSRHRIGEGIEPARKSAQCHPDRRHAANGLCMSCYMTDRKRKRKAARNGKHIKSS